MRGNRKRVHGAQPPELTHSEMLHTYVTNKEGSLQYVCSNTQRSVLLTGVLVQIGLSKR